MQHGFKNYGFKINWKKTSLNFKVPQLDVAEGDNVFKYSDYASSQLLFIPVTYNTAEQLRERGVFSK